MYEYRCTLLKVIDGDTVDVSIDLGFDHSFRARVRLYGIDTPELRTKDKEEKKRGKEAAEFVKGWFAAEGGTVILRSFYDRHGKFGRILGTFFNNSSSLNKELLTLGLAKPYDE